KSNLRIQSNLPLSKRLISGRGALAILGEFAYPVRLIQATEDKMHWTVKWWRGNQFKESEIVPGSVTTVPLDLLRDSLWGKRMERRETRLGLWHHPWEVPSAEDILIHPGSVKFDEDVNRALSPFTDQLRNLLFHPDDVDSETVPAKKWLEDRKKNIVRTSVPYSGSLTTHKRAQIVSWIEEHINKGKRAGIAWIGMLPTAHAETLYISSMLSTKSTQAEDFNTQITRAWSIQFSGTAPHWDHVDVDKECLERLEEEMFERSLFAGIAGHYQWGLDAGDHQDGWDPYAGTPEEWDHRDREGDDAELQTYTDFKRGPDYIEAVVPLRSSSPQPLPRPQPRKKARKLL
ncbi:hypothetical protein H0H93_012466, partial [Arthromyces matolae]